MIPCRAFLQKMQIYPQSSAPKPRLSFTLNSIYYDDIKPFQTKYFCLSTHDALGIEAVLQDDEVMVGKTQISSAYRLALESRTVQVKIVGNGKIYDREIRLTFLFEPVAAFNRRNLDESIDKPMKKIDPFLDENVHNFQNHNHLEISFSQRSPRDPLIETNSINFTRQIQSKQFKAGLKDTYKDIPLFADSYPEENQSLESLAQQREKILGQLFGRFKRDK